MGKRLAGSLGRRRPRRRPLGGAARRQAALLLAAVVALGQGGCSELWGSSRTPNPDNCLGSGCPDGLVCDTELQVCVSPQPPDLATPDLALTPSPTSLIFPAVPEPAQLPIAIPFQLATWQPSTLFYSVDGSEPLPGSSAAGASPLVTPELGSGLLRWRAYGGTGTVLESTQQRTLSLSAQPQDLGALAHSLQFTASGGPLLEVAPGTRVQGKLSFRAWRSTPTGYCPGCILQLVMVVPSVGIPSGGCVENIQGYGSFPGMTGEMNFDFTAPTQPGEYEPYIGLTLQFSCDGSQPGIGRALGRLRVK